jgi:hypothetical protein
LPKKRKRVANHVGLSESWCHGGRSFIRDMAHQQEGSHQRQFDGQGKYIGVV